MIGKTKPNLTDARLRQMQSRASRVWRGESQPQVSMAEDILFLVAEVRDLRAKLSERPTDSDSLFSEADRLFDSADSLFKSSTFSRRTRASKAEVTSEPPSTFTRFRNWMRNL